MTVDIKFTTKIFSAKFAFPVAVPVGLKLVYFLVQIHVTHRIEGTVERKIVRFNICSGENIGVDETARKT